MSDKKKCPFCEAIALQRFIEEHHSKPAGFGMALSAALVSYRGYYYRLRDPVDQKQDDRRTV